MARVVQRRTPPYLLIVFVLLFVLSAVMAVLFLNKYKTAQEQVSNLRARNSELITRDLRDRPEISDMIKTYNTQKRTAGTVPQTVVAQLQAQVTDLAKQITGSPSSTYDEALSQIRQTSESVYSMKKIGLLVRMKELNDALDVKESEVGKLKSDQAQLQADLKKSQDDMAAAKKDFANALAQKDSQIAALDAKFQTFSQAQNTKLDDIKNTYDQTVTVLNKKLAAQADELAKTKRQLEVAGVQIKKLSNPPDRKGPSEEVVYRTDGKVRSISQDQTFAYLDIGSNQRVTEGLRFSVYPYTGIPKDGKGKGVVEVTNVGPDVCEARIVEQNKDNPITPGDKVANVVYNSVRNYKLLVEGDFDLNDTGEATPAGNKAIQELIRRYGGQVVDKLTIGTNFVVLGEPPMKPKPPSDTDPQDRWDLYQARLKSYNRYQQIKDTARSMDIPVIGGQRFLDLIGYVPSKSRPS